MLFIINHCACVCLKRHYFSIWCRSGASTAFSCAPLLKKRSRGKSESLDLFDATMSLIDPMSHSVPPCPGNMLKNTSVTLGKHGNSSEMRASHHHVWIDSSQTLSKFLRPVRSFVSEVSAKVWNLSISSRTFPSGVGSTSLQSSHWFPSES